MDAVPRNARIFWQKCGAVNIAAVQQFRIVENWRKRLTENSSYIHRPTAVILVVAEQLVVGQVSYQSKTSKSVRLILPKLLRTSMSRV